MYHGTTSDLVPVFKEGAKAVKFNAAERTALGMGFYLAANMNEAKDYACTRLKMRLANNPTIKALLLVIGVLEDDKIQGKFVDPSSKGPRNSDDKTGAPLDSSNYFVRNSNLYNQFVFFNNSAPYLKIFDIVELPKGFGKAFNLQDKDGLPMTSTQPDTDAKLKCPY